MRRYFEQEWGQMHVREAGEGDVALVLLHHVSGSSWWWDPVMGPLAERGFRVIAPDLPGYGLSDAPPSNPDLRWYGDVVNALIEAANCATTCVVGRATGASVALQLSVAHADNVRGLVLWSLPYLAPESAALLAHEAVPTYGPEGEEVVNCWKSAYTSGGAEAEGAAMRAVADLMLCGKALPIGHRAVGRAEHEPLLRAVTHPTLAMAGGNLVEETKRAAALIKHCEYIDLGRPAFSILVDDGPAGFVERVHQYTAKIGIRPSLPASLI